MSTMARSARATTPLPLLVQPIFDLKPWGSRRLAALCGELPDGLAHADRMLDELAALLA